MLSKYSLMPQKGLSFEPTVYNTSASPRAFTLTNTGAFAFDFKLFDLKAAQQAASGVATASAPPPAAGKDGKDSKGKDAKSKGKAAVEAVKSVTCGPFVVTPSEGTLEPGAAATLEARFNATGQQSFSETLGIEVQNRAASDNPGGIPFELLGDSCVPGIECSKVESIFEEHTIKQQLDPFAPVNNEYGVKDKV